jgi:hypothetical protein
MKLRIVVTLVAVLGSWTMSAQRSAQARSTNSARRLPVSDDEVGERSEDRQHLSDLRPVR